jgi:hypothetical protein
MLTHSPKHTDYSTDTRVLLTCRLYSTPWWHIRDWRRTNAALEWAKLRRECLTNDYAHRLRALGHEVPVGSVLCGEKVTR